MFKTIAEREIAENMPNSGLHKEEKIESRRTCYARGGVQYFFTIMFGVGFIWILTEPIWGQEVKEELCAFIFANIWLGVFFLYWVLLCMFYRVKVDQNKIVYTNLFNKTFYIDPQEIKGIDSIGGKGMRIKMKGKKIVIYAFYENYREVCKDILELIATTNIIKN